MPYTLVFALETVDHLRALPLAERRRVLRAIKALLLDAPTSVTRNRRPLDAHPVAPWELRIGDLRVYYDVKDGRPPAVEILAIGFKAADGVRIGDKVVGG